MARALEVRFWDKVKKGCGPKGECWEWQGSIGWWGYGRIWFDGREWGAHRLAYTLAKGEIPWGRHILHACDNPPCVNPDHLTAGTPKENIDDCVRKGRRVYCRGDAHGSRKHREKRPRGEGIPRSILNDTIAMEIRRCYSAGGIRMDELAAQHGVKQATISCLVRGVTWAHLPILPPPPRKGPNAKGRATHCAKGHEYNETNAYRGRSSQGYEFWICKQCQKEKWLESFQPAAPVTHCQRGHDFSEANTYWHEGRRRCKTCMADRSRRYREAEKAERRSRPKPTPWRSLRTSCDHGHEYTEASTRYYKGVRQCRVCDAEWHRNDRLKKEKANAQPRETPPIAAS